MELEVQFTSPSHGDGSRGVERNERDETRRDETSNSIDENLHYLFGIKHSSSYSMSKAVAKQKLNRVKASKRQHQIETSTIQVDLCGQ